MFGIDPGNLARVGRDRGFDQQPLERVVEIPVVDHMLVVPDNPAGLPVERQRGIVIKVLQVITAEQELRRRDRDRGADDHQIELRIVARHHPGADMPAFLERHVAPGLVAGFAGARDRACAPQLPACARVMGGYYAGVVTGIRLALPAGDHATVRNDRTGRGAGAQCGFQHRRFPDQSPGARIQCVHLIVGAGVDDRVAPDRDDAIGAAGHAFRIGAPVFPDQIPGGGVHRLDIVSRVRHIDHAVVHQRRSLLHALTHGASPDQPQVRDIVGIDFVERAVAPTVERAAPAQPVCRVRAGQHRIGDRHEAAVLCGAVVCDRTEYERGERGGKSCACHGCSP
jgi:hypothetical protein